MMPPDPSMPSDSNDEEENPTKRRMWDHPWDRWESRVRDGVLFAVGVLGVINELFLIENPRPSALLFLGSLLGVPFILNVDERRLKRRR